MKTFVIGIAGPSGSGKSTLASGLEQTMPGKVATVHMDQYFKDAAKLPIYEDEMNWDDPQAIRDKDLITDVASLKNGELAKNSDTEAKPIIIVEGFLALYFPELRKLYDASVYLKIDPHESVKRRVHPMWDHYRDFVLEPMHQKYLIPTEHYADLVIDAANNNKEQILTEVNKLITKHLAT